MTIFEIYLKRYRLKVSDEIRTTMNDILFRTGYFMYDGIFKLTRRDEHCPPVDIMKITDDGDVVEIYNLDEYTKFTALVIDELTRLIPKSMFPDEPGSIK